MEASRKLTIEDVLNLETGEEVDAYQFFKKPLDEVTEVRSELQRAIAGFRTPLFVCYYCKQNIRIRGGKFANGRKKDSFHFAHLKDSAACHIKTNNSYSKEEVERIKYNGAKESALHIHLKELIAHYLNKNGTSKKEVTNIEIEKVIKGRQLEKEWRKPDINAFFKGMRIAIELQLSTTWLSVITERQHFYKEQGLYMLWVFHNFNLDDAIRKLTYNDVIFTNHHNAFVFDEECIAKSNLENDLVLKCYYKDYFQNGLEIADRWVMTYVTLADLTFDPIHLKVYFHDSKKQKQKITQAIAREQKVRFEKEEEKRRAAEQAQIVQAKLLAQQREREQRKQLEYTRLRDQISDLNEEVKDLKEKKTILGLRISSAKDKITNNTAVLADLTSYAEKAYSYIIGESYSSPIPSKYALVNTLRATFSDPVKQLQLDLQSATSGRNALLHKQALLPKLESFRIADTTYHILPCEDAYFHRLRESWRKMKCIPKSAVDTLFSVFELRSITSESDFIEAFTKNNIYLLIDSKEDILSYSSPIEQSNDALSGLNLQLTALKGRIQEKIKTTLEAENASIDQEVSQFEESQHEIDHALSKLETEIATYRDALANLD